MARRSIPPAPLRGVVSACGIDLDSSVVVSGVSDDSRTISAGDVFFCVRGANFDGHDAALDATSRGAVAVVVDHPLDLPAEVVQVVVPDVREVIGTMASRALGDPSSRLDRKSTRLNSSHT